MSKKRINKAKQQYESLSLKERQEVERLFRARKFLASVGGCHAFKNPHEHY